MRNDSILSVEEITMKLIYRDSYLEQLKAVMNVPDIKVITGIRRSGKSKLMDAFSDYLFSQNNANVIRIRLNIREFSALTDPDALYDYVTSQYQQDKTNYLLIDEVQMCSGFEKVIESLHEEEKYDIYITGSNAFLLSSDLATLFGGRVYEVKVYPFSFAE